MDVEVDWSVRGKSVVKGVKSTDEAAAFIGDALRTLAKDCEIDIFGVEIKLPIEGRVVNGVVTYRRMPGTDPELMELYNEMMGFPNDSANGP